MTEFQPVSDPLIVKKSRKLFGKKLLKGPFGREGNLHVGIGDPWNQDAVAESFVKPLHDNILNLLVRGGDLGEDKGIDLFMVAVV